MHLANNPLKWETPATTTTQFSWLPAVDKTHFNAAFELVFSANLIMDNGYAVSLLVKENPYSAICNVRHVDYNKHKCL